MFSTQAQFAHIIKVYDLYEHTGQSKWPRNESLGRLLSLLIQKYGEPMTASADLLLFVKSARVGEQHQYAHSNGHRPISLMELARILSEQGLVHSVQKPDRNGFAYIAVRTSQPFYSATG